MRKIFIEIDHYDEEKLSNQSTVKTRYCDLTVYTYKEDMSYLLDFIKSVKLNMTNIYKKFVTVFVNLTKVQMVNLIFK